MTQLASTATRGFLGMWSSFLAWIPHVGLAILLVWLSLLGARAVRWGVLRTVRHGPGHENLRLAFARLAYVSVVAVCVLFAATIAFPSFSVGQLIQLLGVSGVVIGFAFKDILQNFLAGILILLTNPFSIGDQIIVADHEGTVVEIQTRATLIRTYERTRVVVPNADLFTQAVTVTTAFPQRRIEYDLDLPVGADVSAMKRAFSELLRSNIDGVSVDPDAEVLILNVTGEGKTTLRLRWWSPSERGEYLIVKDRVLASVLEILASARPTPSQA